MEAPIRSEVAATWVDRRTGPPEAVIRPRSKPLGMCFRVAERLPKPYAGYLREVGARWLTSSPVQLDTAWGTLLVPPHDHMFFRPVFDEPFETAVVTRLLQPGMRVVDVGANRGWFALLMARCVGPEGSVLGFEPDPAARRQLLANIAANDLANVTIVDHACGDADGELRFVAERESALSHLARGADDIGDHDLTVRVRRLDDVVAELAWGHIDFIKIDVEGAEPAVLRGASRLLHGTHPPSLLVEVFEGADPAGDDTSTAIVDLLGDDYRVFRLCWRHGIAEPFPHDACASGRNLLCLPADQVTPTLARLFHVPPQPG